MFWTGPLWVAFLNDWLGKLHTAQSSHILSSAPHQIHSAILVFQTRMLKLRADFISQLARCGDSQNLSSCLKCQLIIFSYSLVNHIYRNLDNCSWWQGWQSLTTRVAYHRPASVKLSVRVMLSGHRVQVFQYSGKRGRKIMSLKVALATQWDIVFKTKRIVSFNPLHYPQLCGTTGCSYLLSRYWNGNFVPGSEPCC